MSGKIALLASAAAASGVHALAVRQAGCSFTMSTEGAVSYPVGQYSSGQTCAGSTLTASAFTISDGALTDAQGRGCWWTPPSTVLQCDVDQVPETGFDIGCDGSVSYNGQSTFYECATADDDVVNIYLQPNQGSNCADITLVANGCATSSCSGETNSVSAGMTASTSISTSPAAATAASTTEMTSQAMVSTIYSTTWLTVTSCDEAVTVCECNTAASVPSESSQGATTTALVVSSSAGVTGTATPLSSQASTLATSSPSSTSVYTAPVQTSSAATSSTSEAIESESCDTSTGTPSVVDTTLSQTLTTMTTTSHTTLTVGTTVTSMSSYTPQMTTNSASSSAGSSSATQTVDVPVPSSVSIPESCPGDVSNAGEFTLPSLIVPIDSSSPDTASGTSYFGEVSSTISTIFNFDIPSSDSGKTCNLIFLFPEQSTLETSSYTFSGSGAIDFSELSGVADENTSYSNAPSVASELGQFTVSPGNAYNVWSSACPAGETISIEMAIVAGGDTQLRFFQDYNPCPIGMFITVS